ncbi:MAG TPA: phosphoenolpyruvate carboxykinase (GTP) [Planctomycetota bacterium]|nr:phosphoenolpyruvate carboxykinase (GTP) [Planctomycetota bacterium]HRR82329.1 phosphoenolpyruvate carboxykinase (GTP) [Planctomycetota bacterium]HRT95455.1 phosphoenolpyruvate carboxykinase (GTP) [Planctomycetota bacterium]
MTEHRELNQWIRECAELCQPDRIVWVDGSDEQRRALLAEACKTGEFIELNQEKLPGCYYHRSALNDVARTEGLTYVCTSTEEEAGPTNNWMAPEEARDKAAAIFAGSMRGRTMYVIPFSMGPIGSPFSKIGVELTDSIYVVINMLIMTRAGKAVLDQLGTTGDFTRCLHGKAELDLKRRLILHFPEDNTIWSVGSGYGGNALLGKKCLSLRIAGYLAKREGWMAEHMLILGVEHPDGQVDYIAGAFPSACGKTNLAMLVPPEALARKGYKVWTVGDDIAWMRVGADGRLWACNPESGFFGVVPGTSSRSNPNAVRTLARNSLYTNTAFCPDDRTVWWEGSDSPPPANLLDWRGQPWHPGMVDEHGKKMPGAHPNSRFTAPAAQCPSIAPNWEDPQGVPISAILFGARRERLAPLVYQCFNWQHAVYVAATMVSERTAAAEGKRGEIRHDPMAMLPFCGYNMADYFQHWLDMGKRITHRPKIFRVNWFRTDDDGRFLWPGFGENLRILLWCLDRCHGRGGAIKAPIGYVPTYDSIDWTGLDFPRDTFGELHAIYTEDWLEEQAQNRQFLAQFGSRLPHELWYEHAARDHRLRGEE